MHYRLQNAQKQRGAKPKDYENDAQNIEIYSTFLSIMTTEVLFYPFETILHRIQLQGTRTIIDNLDSGYSVVPILTNYEGAVDCYRTTIATEGVSGLYKGKYSLRSPNYRIQFSDQLNSFEICLLCFQVSVQWFFNLPPIMP